MIGHIAALELRRLFLSPLAWCVLAVEQLILAYFFLIAVDNYIEWQPRLAAVAGAPGVSDIIVGPLFGDASMFMLFAVPIMTMRLLSEERRAQTLSLLFSAPVSMTEIVLGKFLGAAAFFLILVCMIALMPLSLLVGVNLDFGVFWSSLLGASLLVSSFVAVGLYMSTLTAQPAIAAVSTFGVLLLLWVIDWAGGDRAGDYSGVFAYLSTLRHYEPLLKGVFNSSDVLYYLLFIATFLILSIRRLDADRLRH